MSLERCTVCDRPWQGRPICRYGGAKIESCGECGSWMYFPRPAPSDQAKLHDSDEYFDHPYFAERRKNSLSRRRAERVATLIGGHAPDFARSQGRLLDVGCDTGEFMQELGAILAVESVGVDVASRAVHSAQKLGRQAYHCDIVGAPPSLTNFDLVTAIDLIEHVAEPRALFVAIRQRLKAGGLFYFETPNLASTVYGVGAMGARLFGGRPHAVYERLFPPQHVHYFNESSLHALLSACGFRSLHYGKRSLPLDEISASLPVKAGLAPLQFWDRLTSRGIILYGLFQACPS